MTVPPFVGPPTSRDGGCAFAVDIDHPACGRMPAVHILSESAAWGLVGMAACDAHAPVARSAATSLDEHVWTVACEAGCWAYAPDR